MQATSKDLYKAVALIMQVDEILVKSVGDVVFYNTFLFFKNPTSLICKLKGMGYWYIRKKRLDKYLHTFNTYYTRDPLPEFKDEKGLKAYLKDRAQFELLLERQKDYEKFLEKKAAIKAIRYKTQPIVKTKNQEEC